MTGSVVLSPKSTGWPRVYGLSGGRLTGWLLGMGSVGSRAVALPAGRLRAWVASVRSAGCCSLPPSLAHSLTLSLAWPVRRLLLAARTLIALSSRSIKASVTQLIKYSTKMVSLTPSNTSDGNGQRLVDCTA